MFTEEGAVAHEKSGRSAKNGAFEPSQATPKVDVQVPTVVGNAMFWIGACAEETNPVETRTMNIPRMKMRDFMSATHQEELPFSLPTDPHCDGFLWYGIPLQTETATRISPGGCYLCRRRPFDCAQGRPYCPTHFRVQYRGPHRVRPLAWRSIGSAGLDFRGMGEVSPLL